MARWLISGATLVGIVVRSGTLIVGRNFFDDVFVVAAKGPARANV